MTPPRAKKDTWTSCAGRWLATLLLALATTLVITLVSAPLMAPPAHATGDTLSLSIDNGTTFIYGQSPVPTFSAVVTFGVKPTANYFWMVKIKLDDGETINTVNSPTSGDNGMTLTFDRITSPTPIHAGQRTATASFYDPGTGTTAVSNPVVFVVNKATVYIACVIDGADVHFVGLSKSLRIQMEPSIESGQLPADFLNGTYTVTFDGPAHVTVPNLSLDSNYGVTLTGPSQLGVYTLSCAFSGTSLYNADHFTDPHPYTFSAMHSLGGAQLYTNPTTLTPSTPTDFYLVLRAASGLPVPTGEFQFWIGPYYTKSIPLTSAGDCLVQLTAPMSLAGASQITVKYWGDTYYNAATINFPLTNPPIPGGGGGGKGGGGKGQATATAAATGIADATATTGGDAATPTAAGAGGVLTATPPGGDNNGLPLLIIALAVLGMLVALGGAAALVIYASRRRKSLAPTSPGGFEPRPSGYAPPYGVAYGDPYPMPPHQQASQSPERPMPPMPSVDD